MNKVVQAVQSFFRSPVIWGGLVAVAFYLLIYADVLQGVWVYRYFCSHPVEHASIGLFCMAMCALIMTQMDTWGQGRFTKVRVLEEAPRGLQTPAECTTLLAKMKGLPEDQRNSLLGLRVKTALEYVQRKNSANDLEVQLKEWANLDREANRGHDGLVGIVIWAIPILGFLGTVMGITDAIANIDPQALEGSMDKVTAGLAVAFDTTALALALSMVLMFTRFRVDRSQERFFNLLDQRASQELSNRFQTSDSDGSLPTELKHLSQNMAQHTERLVQRQVDLWRSALEDAFRHWQRLASTTQEQLDTALTSALSKTLTAHADQIAASEMSLAETNRRHWGDMHRVLAEATKALQSQQGELVRQGEVLLKVVDATGQVTRLEEALRRNLQVLAKEQQLEQTMLSLSTAVHLLTSRLSSVAPTSLTLLDRPARDMEQAA